MIDEGWLSDSEGRIENIALAPNAKNAMFPLFEAIMNSIQSIEERFGRDALAEGVIDITIHGDEQGEYVGFSVADNGIGFTKEIPCAGDKGYPRQTSGTNLKARERASSILSRSKKR